jgi:hypothetical protein
MALSVSGRQPNSTGATGDAATAMAGVTPDAAGAGAVGTGEGAAEPGSGNTSGRGVRPEAKPGFRMVDDVETELPGDAAGTCARQATDSPNPQANTRQERKHKE